MDNFGPFSDFKGEHSDIPAFAIGKDPDHIASLTALTSRLMGVAVPNRTLHLPESEIKCNFKCFFANYYL
jgi:hypothetical protein